MPTERKPKKYDKKRFVVATLRKASLRWPARNEAKKLARIERGFYKCNACEKAFGPKEIHVDHIKPVVSIKEGFINWDEFIDGLFCEIENLQVLCTHCHASKTLIESEIRKKYKNGSNRRSNRK